MTDPSTSLQHTWHEVVAEVQQLAQTPNSGVAPLNHQQRAFLQLAKPAALVEGIAVISVSSPRAKDFIERELGATITQILSQRFGRAYTLAVTVSAPEEVTPPAQQHVERQHIDLRSSRQQQPVHKQPEHQEPAQPEPTQHYQEEPYQEKPQWKTTHVEEQRSFEHQNTSSSMGYARPQQNSSAQPAAPRSDLNADYTFENYVVSDSNKLPWSAAIAVAEKPARSYNPLFIWGDSGLGKTHLMHAIGNYAHQLDPSLRIKYVSSEEFTNDYINSLRDDLAEAFKRRYRELDILMVDDIQFLQGKEGTQEEFFHTFNALKQANKQIVLSSDRPPKLLTTLEDRLRTRFQSGLIADIYPPDLETRIAILMKKAQAEGVYPEREVMELIAERFNTSIRELEGALIRVSAYASLNKLPINLATAETALRDMMPEQAEVEVTPEMIIQATSEFFDVSVDLMKGTSKSRPIVYARQMAMYLCRELTELSLPRIGDHFGGKDHSTVIHAERKIRNEIAKNQDAYDQIQSLTQRIKNSHR